MLKASQINGGNGIKTVVNSKGFIMNSRGVLPRFKKSLTLLVLLLSSSIALSQTATNQTISVTEDTTSSNNSLNLVLGTQGGVKQFNIVTITSPVNATINTDGQSVVIDTHTITFNGIGTANISIDIDPFLNFNGTSSFVYNATDNKNNVSNNATVSIEVSAVNDAPVVTSTTMTATEQVTSTLDLSGNATDIESDGLTYNVVDQGSNGSASFSGSVLSYTSNSDSATSDVVTFRVTDDGTPNLTSNIGTVTVTITGVNDPPVAVSSSTTVDEQIATAIDLSAYATDPDPGVTNYTYALVGSPSNGTASVSGATLTYQSNSDSASSDALTFKINDGEFDSNIATLTININGINDTPVAAGQSFSATEDVQATITLNASDPDGDSLTVVQTANPDGHSITYSGTTATFTSASNFNGNSSFSYKVTDGTLESSEATVNLSIAAVNDAPVAANVSDVAREFIQATIPLSATDVDSGSLTYSIVSPPSKGSASISGTNVIYTSTVSAETTDTLNYKANDGALDSNTATLTISIIPDNESPVATNATVSATEQVAATWDISAYVTDNEGDSLTYSIISGPSSGSASFSGSNLTYTSNSDTATSDVITYRAADQYSNSNIGTLTITISPVNDGPTATNQTENITEDTTSSFSLSISDPESDSMSIVVTTNADNHTLTLSGTTATITPAENVDGNSTIIYYVTDGQINSDNAILSLIIGSVNDAPVSSNVTGTVTEQVQGVINLSATDIDSNTLTYSIVSSPSNGTATVSGSTILYTSNSDTATSDTLTYKANDGALDSNVSTATISITPVNDGPSATSQAVSFNEDIQTSFALNVSDPESDTLSLTVVTNPDNHSLTLSGTTATIVPATDFNGSSTMSYKVSDGEFESTVAVLTLTIAAVNDAPVSSAVSATVDEQSSVTFALSATDIDVGDTVSYSIVSNPTYGSVVLTGANVTYTNSSDFALTDSFTYQATDGALNSNIATATLSINPVNDTPTAVNSSTTVLEQIQTEVDLSSVVSDPDNDPLTFHLLDGPFNGTATFSGTVLTYQSNSDTATSDLLTFYVSDGSLNSSTVVLSITITPVNDPPVVGNLSLSAVEQQPATIDLNGQATDVESDSVTYAIASQPSNGAATISGTVITYTSNSDTATSDSFTYVANDGTDNSDPATISVTISPVNDAPSTTNGSATVIEQIVSTFDLSSNSSDPEGDDLTVVILSGPFEGTATVSGTTITYISNSDTATSDLFTFKVNDGSNDSNSSAYQISIAAVNDAPVATAQSVSFDQNSTKEFVLSVVDPESDSLSLVIDENPDSHTMTLSGTTAVISPTHNFFGSSYIRYHVYDGNLNSNTVTLSLQINEINLAPEISSNFSTITIDEDSTKLIDVSVSDFNVNDTHTIDIVSFEDAATLTTSGTQISYTPRSNFNGSTSFVFRVFDGELYSDSVRVDLVVSPVNDAPVINGSYSAVIDEDTSTTFDIAVSDIEFDSISLETYSNADAASITYSGTTVFYTPKINLVGQSSFQIRAFDGTNYSQPKTISVYLIDTNKAPTISSAQSITFDEDSTASINLTVSDPDEDPLTLSVVNNPNNMSVTFSGTIALISPPANFNGSSSIGIQVSDGRLSSSTHTIAINVTSINDAPQISGTYSASIDENTSTNFEIEMSDVDSTNLSLVTYSNPDGATISFNGSTITYTPALNFFGDTYFEVRAFDGSVYSEVLKINISVSNTINSSPQVSGTYAATIDEDTSATFVIQVLDPDGDQVTLETYANPDNASISYQGKTISYTPALNLNGSTSFSFRAFDGFSYSEIITVPIEINAINDAPIVSDMSLNVLIDNPVNGTFVATDPEGDNVTFGISNWPSVGTLVFTSANTGIYTPPTGFTGTVSFTYNASDGKIVSDDAVVELNFYPQSFFVPVVNDLYISGERNKSIDDIKLIVDVIAGIEIGFEITEQPQHGTVSITSVKDNYAIAKYTPTDPEYEGRDEFTFKASNGDYNSQEAKVYIQLYRGLRTEAKIVHHTIKGTSANENFGKSVDIDGMGDHIIIGAPNSDLIKTDAGTVQVSFIGANDFVEDSIDLSTINANNQLGELVKISPDGNTIAVYSNKNSSTDGELRIYAKEGSSWVQKGQTIDHQVHHIQLSIDGSIIAISNPYSNKSFVKAGEVIAFKYNKETNRWSDYSEHFYGSSSGGLLGFGFALDGIGRVIVIGEPGNSENGEKSGKVTAYKYNGVNWDQLGQSLYGAEAGAEFGYSVSTCAMGECIIVGAPFENHNNLNDTGAIRRYKFDGQQWSQIGTAYYGLEAEENLGTVVQLSRDRYSIASGSTFLNENTQAGLIRIFENNNENWNQIIEPITGGQLNDQFATTFAFSGDHTKIIAGAPYADNNGIVNAGEVNVYNLINYTPIALDQYLEVDEDKTNTLELSFSDSDSDELSVEIVDQPSNGSVTVSGTLVYYTPVEHYTGTDSFTYRVFDGQFYSEPAKISLQVNDVNDPPIVTGIFSTTISEDETILLNYEVTDEENDPVEFVIVSNPDNAQILIQGYQIVYTPPSNFQGTTSFTFSAVEASGVSATHTVNFVVTEKNDPPVILNPEQLTKTLEEDVQAYIPLQLYDVEGDEISVKVTDNPDEGFIEYINSSFYYTPINNFNGTTGFTFELSDGINSTTYSVSLNYLPVNDPPTVFSTVIYVPVNTVVSGRFVGVDPDSTIEYFEMLSLPEVGEFEMISESEAIYTPELDFEGTIEIVYAAFDGELQSLPGVITVIFKPLSYFTPKTTQILASVEKNSTSNPIVISAKTPNVVAINYEITRSPVHGEVVIDSQNTGQVLYTPVSNFEGVDEFSYVAKFGELVSEEKTVEVKVFNNYRSEPKLIGEALSSEQANDLWGHSVAISSDGSLIAGTAPSYDSAASNSGIAKLWKLEQDTWVEEFDFGETLGIDEQYGQDIVMNDQGTVVAVSSLGLEADSENGNFIDVYEFDGAQWKQKGSRIYSINGQLSFGASIALNSFGDKLFVGVPKSNFSGVNSGLTTVYKFDDDLQDWKFTAENRYGDRFNDLLGSSIAVNRDGRSLAMGVPGRDTNGNKSGAVKIFKFNGVNWTQTGATILGDTADDQFGSSVAMDDMGTTIVVGAPNHDSDGLDNNGQLKVFVFDGQQWQLKGEPIMGSSSNEHLGAVVSIENQGNLISVSSPGFDKRSADQGKVATYKFSNNSWNLISEAFGSQANGLFGSDMQLSGDQSSLIVSSKYSEDSADDSGAIQTYKLINFTPIVENASFEVYEGLTNNLDLPTLDQEGDELTYEVVNQPSNGSVSIVDGVIQYTANEAYLGADQIKVIAKDADSESNIITVNLQVLPNDADADGVMDLYDNCLDTYNPNQEDFDGDGIGDLCDEDIDNDGIVNVEDVFPLDPNEWEDFDGDGVGDNSDPDLDNDGVLNEEDVFPLNAEEWDDKDGDGVGDNEDLDDDGDGKFDPLVVSELLTPGTGTLESNFILLDAERFPKNKLTIIDKDRKVVFEASNYQNDWKGTYGKAGGQLPEGSYYYIFQRTPDEMAQEGWIYIKY